MNESPDPLDRLMARTPPPPAPPWFEQRLMARVRAGAALPWWRRAWRDLGLPGRVLVPAGAAAAIVLALGLWPRTDAPPPASMLAQEDFNQAFDAFASYSEQARTWNVEW